MAQKKQREVPGKKKEASSEDIETVISPDTSLGKFKSGYVLNNRFVIKKMLGRGGMGIVYEAWDKELEQDVAIKVLRPDIFSDTILQRLKREIKLARRIGHKNIARVYDINEHEEYKFISMELLDGETLHQKIYKNKRLPLGEFLDLAIQITLAVDAAHEENIIHRDLKPGNIIITGDGVVKVLDFGLAFSPVEERLTQTDAVMGTMEYISPEQAEGKTATPRSDIYSLGVIFFNMITGDLPFKGETPVITAMKHIKDEVPLPSSFNKEIPPALEKIILKCMEKDPRQRYESCRELLADLKSLKKEPGRAKIHFRLRPRFLKIAAVAAIFVAVLAAAYFFLLKSPVLSMPDINMEVAIIGERMDLMGNVIEVLIRDDGTLYSKDGFQVHVNVDRQTYLYVIDMDESGMVEMLFPRSEISIPHRLEANKKYVLPGENLWYRLDETVGKENLFVLASEEPNEKIDNLLASLKSAGLDVKIKPSFDLSAELSSAERGIKGIDTGRVSEFYLSDGKEIKLASEIIRGSSSVVKTISFFHK